MAPKDYGYIFEPAVDYQPRVVKEYVVVCNGKAIVDADGTVRLNPDSKSSGFDVLGHQINPKGYNSYEINGWNFAAYKSAAFQLWKKRPKGLSWVDHIDRDRTNDSFSNLRPVNASLNNLNQYRPTTKGYVHETQEWVDKVNAARAAKRQRPLILKEPPRNKYISCCTYKGVRHEFGVFDDPEDATACYMLSKEPFIQDCLREMWTEFLFA